jgi:hypothetical protein
MTIFAKSGITVRDCLPAADLMMRVFNCYILICYVLSFVI